MLLSLKRTGKTCGGRVHLQTSGSTREQASFVDLLRQKLPFAQLFSKQNHAVRSSRILNFRPMIHPAILFFQSVQRSATLHLMERPLLTHPFGTVFFFFLCVALNRCSSWNHTEPFLFGVNLSAPFTLPVAQQHLPSVLAASRLSPVQGMEMSRLWL